MGSARGGLPSKMQLLWPSDWIDANLCWVIFRWERQEFC